MGSMIPAVCLPSRTMLITGRSLWRHSRPTRGPRPRRPACRCCPRSLAEAGYVTFHCGKASNSCTFGNAAFDTNIETNGRTAESATEHADQALEFLRACTTASGHSSCISRRRCRTIRGWRPPEFDADVRSGEALALARTSCREHPFDNGELTIRDELLAPHPRTPEAMRQHLADYYATISHLDHEVGRILDALDQRGWADNTIVIFSSDQGLAVGGRHGLMGKQNLYEHVKPPLIVAGPGIPRGKSDALVYLFDLFPTICDLAGATTPAVVEGKSLLRDHRRARNERARLVVLRLPRLPANGSRRALEADPIQRRGRQEHATVRSGRRSRRTPEPGGRPASSPPSAPGWKQLMIEGPQEFGDPGRFLSGRAR